MLRAQSAPAHLIALAACVALFACGDDPSSGIPQRDGGSDVADDAGGPDSDAADDSEPGGSGEPADVTDVSDDSADVGGDTGEDGGAESCVSGSVRPCFAGDAEQVGVGVCEAGVQQCVDGVWGECENDTPPSEEVCDGVDNDCDNEVDDGVSNACGLCGAVQLEVCDDGLDNDCNGVIDDVTAGCACGGRLDQPCYSGPPHTLGIGLCVGGEMDCVEGAWGTCESEVTPTEEICDGLDNDCDGEIDEGTRNACGECANALPIEECDGIDNDCDGFVDEGVRGACGICLDELGEEVCGDGLDNDCDGDIDEGCACAGEETCYPGPPDAIGVGLCRAGTRSCDATGELWGPCEDYVLPGVEVCDGEDNDCDGTIDLDTSGCSLCSTDIEVCDGEDNDCDGVVDEGLLNACGQCVEDVVEESTLGPEFCNGGDDDCDGLIDEGLLNECGTCNDEDCGECEFFVEGWSDEERCGDGQDNDDDGQADEGCPCEFGESQLCFLGPPNSRRIGQCLDGTQTCIDRGDPHWGPCEGGILPSDEVCDDKDNDCNGCVDDGAPCDVVLACPVSDTITPLRSYALNGDAIYSGDAPVEAWRWTIEGPAGSATAFPDDPNAMNTSFYVDVSGDYRITVEITIDGEVYSCTWILMARGSGLRVELIWDTFGSVDLDLHMHEPGSTSDWCDVEDTCFYGNCIEDGPNLFADYPDWGYPDSTGGCPAGMSTCRNPRLDIDNIDDFDPENINIDNPNDGDSFRIMVHAYSGIGGFFGEDTRAEVRIYCGGFLAAELGVAPDTVTLTDSGSGCQGDTWRVADVVMNIDEDDDTATCDVNVLSGSRDGWDIRNDDDSY